MLTVPAGVPHTRRQRHPLIQVVRDWGEVEEALRRLEPELRAKVAAAPGGHAAQEH